MKKQNGITLISLIITIIIMLILAGVSLSMIMGDGSMLDQANAAAENTKLAEVQEYVDLATASNKMAKYSGMGAKSKNTIVIEMAEQGLITDAQKAEVLDGANLVINGTEIEFSELITSYDDVPKTLSGVWTFNDTIDFSQIETYISQSITYKNSGYATDREMMGVSTYNGGVIVYSTSGAELYNSGSWSDDIYKVVDFGTVEQSVSNEFYDWFIVNATKN